jgi:TonB-linked SusC/RagA family outer membrane protein
MKQVLFTLFVLIGSISMTFGQRVVSGKVTDSAGEALIGANVVVKNSSDVGTITDVEGMFSLKVPSGAAFLVISYTGYESKEIELGNQNVVNVTLSEGQLIQEIVVTGSGSGRDKRKTAFEVQSIGASALPQVPTSSVDQALIGKIAGAQISSVNGTPGAKTSIVLRGINTINRGTSPMIMVDGVEMGSTDLNTLDQNMIDRVEVVQGAVAASIYGAQGANGVIQIFTKKGTKGKTRINFSTSVSNNQYLNIGGVKKANLHGFNTNANNEVIGGSGNPLSYDNETGTYSENLIWASTNPATKINKPYDKNLQYVDHFAMFFKPATNTNTTLSFSGGADKFDFNIGLGHNTQESNLLNNGDFKRTNLTVNLGFEVFKNFTIRSISQLGYTKSSINDGGGNSTIYAAFNSRPFLDYSKKLDDGTYPAYLGDAGGVNGLNPFFINQYSTSKDEKIDLIQSFNANYKVTKWLELDSKLGINYQNQDNNYVYQNQTLNRNVQETETWWYSYNSSDASGELINNQYRTKFTNSLTSARLNFELPKNITSNTYIAFDYRNKTETAYRTGGIGLPTYTPFTGKQAATQLVREDSKTPFVTYGFVLSQQFDFGDKFGIGGGLRSDYSSAFGAGSDPFTFGRGNAYVRISSFDFWDGIKSVIPEFKIRGGYGTAGIQPKPFDRYKVLNTNQIGSGIGFSLPSSQSNPNLNVEQSSELEFGADIGFKPSDGQWFSSISFSPTYWKRETKNAIWDVDFIPSVGIGTYKDNSFSLGSSGFQFTINADVLQTKEFSWNFKTNFGTQSSEITAVKGPPVVLISAAGSTGYVLQEGLKIGQLFGYLALNDVAAKDASGNFYIPADQQANYVVASNGYVVNKTTKAPYFTAGQYSFGDPNPKFNMSFINSLSFSGFALNFQFDWLQGAHLYNQTKEWMYRDGIHSDYQNPITIDGQTGAWSAFYRGVYAERSRNGTKSYFYEDASFVRLRNIQVVVDLLKFFKTDKLSRLDLNLAGRNLLTWTKYTGMDPEVNSSNVYSNNSAWDRGTDHNTMPNLRSYQIGLNVGF